MGLGKCPHFPTHVQPPAHPHPHTPYSSGHLGNNTVIATRASHVTAGGEGLSRRATVIRKYDPGDPEVESA